jgi:hypothetical protein
MSVERAQFVSVSVGYHFAEGRSKRAKRNTTAREWETAGVAVRLIQDMGEELARRIESEPGAAR